MQAAWSHLLDDDFVHAWKYGMVVTCAVTFVDVFTLGYLLTQRITQRSQSSYIYYYNICTDSKHLEFFLLQFGIRDSYSPRCLAPNTRLEWLGHPIGGKAIQDLLIDISAVPTNVSTPSVVTGAGF